MAILSAEAKLYTGIRCWCVDKNATANLTASFSIGNRNRPLESGTTVYPGCLPQRLIRISADLESTATLSRTDQRYKTYGYKADMVIESSLVCKFPTYLRIDLEKLQLPEGTDCIVKLEEGWILEGDYPGSTFAPSAEIPEFFTFRTPWFSGRLRMNSQFNFTHNLELRKGGQAATNTTSSITARGVLNPGKFAAIIGGSMFILPTANYKVQGRAATTTTATLNNLAKRIREPGTNNFNIESTLTLPDFMVVTEFSAALSTEFTTFADPMKYKGIVNEVFASTTAVSAGVNRRAGGRSTISATATSSIQARATKRAVSSASIQASVSSNITRITPSLLGFGINTNGQLGLGNTTSPITTPTQIGIEWDAFATGQLHSIGIKNGVMYAWGLNTSGQLGQGNTTGSLTIPTQIGTDTDWSEIYCGPRFNIAKKTNGTIWGWGANSNYELGLNDTTTRTVPTQIGAVTTWNKISCGQTHVIATRTDGTLWLWGDNISGQLGFGEYDGNSVIIYNKKVPTRLGTGTNWIFVNAGGASSFAIDSSSNLFAWGSNAYGQLGLGNTTHPQFTPVQVIGTGWSSISTGGYTGVSPATAYSTLAIRNGSLYSTGGNQFGELGLGDTTQRTTFTQVGTFTDWTKVCSAIVTGSSYAIRSNRLYSWGNNTFGQLGHGDTTQRTTPTQIGTDPFWLDVDAGQGHVIAKGPAYL